MEIFDQFCSLKTPAFKRIKQKNKQVLRPACFNERLVQIGVHCFKQCVVAICPVHQTGQVFLTDEFAFFADRFRRFIGDKVCTVIQICGFCLIVPEFCEPVLCDCLRILQIEISADVAHTGSRLTKTMGIAACNACPASAVKCGAEYHFLVWNACIVV